MTQEAMLWLQDQEHLRQQAVAFNHDVKVRNRRSILQTALGWSSIVIFAVIAAISGIVLLNSEAYTETVVAGAAATLFVDALGLVTTVWKFVLQAGESPSAQLLVNVAPSRAQVASETPSESATPEEVA